MKSVNRKMFKWNSGISRVQTIGTIGTISTNMLHGDYNVFTGRRKASFLQKYGWFDVRKKTAKLIYSRYTHTGFVITKRHPDINVRKNIGRRNEV